MEKLICAVQNYEWGKRGAQSVISKLNFVANVEDNKPYAELWMGTHPNGPSKLADKGLSLEEYIKSNPNVLGAHEQGKLQFLFKILSVGKALSIQSHPTKEQARELHAKDPKNYPDSNHKPELAIAISDFQLLCGFRQCHQILSNVKAHKELLELISEDDLANLASEHTSESEKNKHGLQAIFSTVWKAPQAQIARVIQEIVTRLSKTENPAPVDKLILQLNDQYPGGDVGVLAPFFLNYFTLSPGESVFVGPNEPHAYLFGDCIECMACSDNTIRAGLTPKYKDVDTLCQNLTYKMSDCPYFQPSEYCDGVVEYSPPGISEFAVHKISSEASFLPELGSSSILLVISGQSTIQNEESSKNLKPGDVFFLPKSLSQLSFKDSSADFVAFRALSSA
uniref:mannose-6-phosphate isomerase n=1 Tax=Ditylenchus dipsaci TaxID=166011 RepID=A0A915E370_9BILA